MNPRLLIKIGAILLTAALLLIPVFQIQGLVSEREQTRDSVVLEIARSAGHAQTITGPILIVPYTRKVRSWSEQREGEGEPRRLIETEVAGRLSFLPSDFELSGKLQVDERQRGIYHAMIFDADTRITGAFELAPNYGIATDLADYTFSPPVLALGISDIRGIGNALELQWNGEPLLFEPGATPSVLVSGVHATLPLLDLARSHELPFSIGLSLQGTGEFHVTPMGRESRVLLTSNWPHPSFNGEFLPREREVTAAGFSARWQTSFFSTNLENVVRACEGAALDNPACRELSSRHFGVSFIDPVDHYLKSERATKYAFLFIGLTFAACFSFEVLRRFSVHPIQYGLVGLALAVFFLLLLSLSEHLGFALAYLSSAVACVSLVGYYVAHVVQDSKLGIAFGCALGALYGMLYVILGAEDYALLLGSLVVFGVLGAIMVLTRQVSWAKFGQPTDGAEAARSPVSPV
jgi:inner membrane protein